MHLTHPVLFASIEKHALSGCCLTSVDVGDNSNISDSLERVFAGHRLASEMREGAIGLGHLLHILFLLDGVAFIVRCGHDFCRQAFRHGLA